MGTVFDLFLAINNKKIEKLVTILQKWSLASVAMETSVMLRAPRCHEQGNRHARRR
ncbi:MAG: hypothetical protein FWG56_02715 [Desulfovibrionaceae bacterium]|jgi:hypothetical protein|nr:hypothetical protein [Desulfovibrionaceae bacterium]